MKLSIVVPCYNEEEVLEESSKQLLSLLKKLVDSKEVDESSYIYFVDDGSKDKTWEIISSLSTTYAQIKGIKLSRNQGHQNALLSGLFSAEGDALISIDADLQDDVLVIEQMVKDFKNGSDVVYGVRSKRESDTPFKRFSAEGFYKLMGLMGVDIVFNHADYRLMSRRVVEHLKSYEEVNLFLRAMVPLIGFSSSIVEYERSERFAGESKYPLRKMLSFAWDGVTSFSVVPLRLISAIGVIIFVVSLFISIWALGIKLFGDSAVPGWASTVLPIYFIGGIQLLSLGVIGEYVGKIYSETKKRPKYIIEKEVG